MSRAVRAEAEPPHGAPLAAYCGNRAAAGRDGNPVVGGGKQRRGIAQAQHVHPGYGEMRIDQRLAAHRRIAGDVFQGIERPARGVPHRHAGKPGGTFRLAKIAGLNADGRSGLVFEDAAGDHAVWLLDHAGIVGGGNLAGLAADWTVA